jgi:outer membrane scaffolding protein for murein synthesis (MipA/OmpV family)
MPFMAAIAFDTMKLVRRLEAAGMNQPQATGVAEALAETMVVEPATRADMQRLDARVTGEIAGLRSDMQVEFATVRGELQAGFASTKVELLRWILPLFLAQMAMIIGVLVRLQP